jgi:hypothetical protein
MAEKDKIDYTCYEKEIWCRDGRHRKVKIQRVRIPIMHHSVGWCYIVSYYNNPDDWNIWYNYDNPEKCPFKIRPSC